MTSTPTIPQAPRAVNARPARLGVVLGVHTLTDFFSFLFIPIMSVLEGRLAMTPAQGAIIIGAGSICSGLIQPVVAWAGDRLDTRMLSPIALAVAVLSISMVGQATEFWHLLVIQIVGTAGIGAFHPAAVAAVGQLSGRRRSLGVSLFFFCGMAGGVLGNNFSPLMERTIGLPGYMWLIAPGLVGVGLLTWAIRRVPHRHQDAAQVRSTWTPLESAQRWSALGVLYVGNVIRFTVNMMMVQLIIRWTEQVVLAREGVATLDPLLRQSASQLNGPMQGAMQLGMALGGLGAGILLRTHHERAALVAVPLVGALAVAGFPYAGALSELGGVALLLPIAFVLAMATGVGYAGTAPLTIALAQRLLPHRTGLASGVMMGGAWGLAAVGPPLAQMLVKTIGLTPAFWVTAGVLASSGLLSLRLSPALLARISPH
jgi:MFS transporter, FSR family, fosmidomycin resistance protein